MGLEQDFYRMVLPMQPIMGKRVWAASICSCGREMYLEELEPGLGMYRFSHLCRTDESAKIVDAIVEEVRKKIEEDFKLWKESGY